MKRLSLVFLLGVILVTVPALPSISACHRFFFNPMAYTVNEGAGSVSVTVERDATVAPSQVKVSTVDDTAKSGQDFAGFENQTLVFGSEKNKPVSITITNDSSVEGTEIFKVKLSEPGNAPPPNPPCPNPQFQVGETATVTIQDNDSAPQSSPQPAGRTSPRTTPTASPTATVSPTLEATAESPLPLEASPTESPEAEVETAVEEDGGTPIGLIIAAVAGILVVAGGAFMLMRRRAAG